MHPGLLVWLWLVSMSVLLARRSTQTVWLISWMMRQLASTCNPSRGLWPSVSGGIRPIHPNLSSSTAWQMEATCSPFSQRKQLVAELLRIGFGWCPRQRNSIGSWWIYLRSWGAWKCVCTLTLVMPYPMFLLIFMYFLRSMHLCNRTVIFEDCFIKPNL